MSTETEYSLLGSLYKSVTNTLGLSQSEVNTNPQPEKEETKSVFSTDTTKCIEKFEIIEQYNDIQIPVTNDAASVDLETQNIPKPLHKRNDSESSEPLVCEQDTKPIIQIITSPSPNDTESLNISPVNHQTYKNEKKNKCYVFRHSERWDKTHPISWFFMKCVVNEFDSPLTNNGISYAENMGKRISIYDKDFKPKAIYCSPLLRCMQTACAIRRGILKTNKSIKYLPIIIDHIYSEHNYTEELTCDIYPYGLPHIHNAENGNAFTINYPESPLELNNRGKYIIDNLISNFQEDTIIVSHGSVVANLNTQLTGDQDIPMTHADEQELAHTVDYLGYITTTFKNREMVHLDSNLSPCLEI
jgi:broad specificity phosphatase PhoE